MFLRRSNMTDVSPTRASERTLSDRLSSEVTQSNMMARGIDPEKLKTRLYSFAPQQAPINTRAMAFKRPTNTQIKLAAVPSGPRLEPLVLNHLAIARKLKIFWMFCNFISPLCSLPWKCIKCATDPSTFRGRRESGWCAKRAASRKKGRSLTPRRSALSFLIATLSHSSLFSLQSPHPRLYSNPNRGRCCLDFNLWRTSVRKNLLHLDVKREDWLTLTDPLRRTPDSENVCCYSLQLQISTYMLLYKCNMFVAYSTGSSDMYEIINYVRTNSKAGFLYLSPAVPKSSVTYHYYNLK